ncbi:unnamed protein product [Spirodela intermedia]|uniref:Fe2OG dioxygenase domain-containing protein n=1 Tax=Spirodela intermedia TaxID=51605 RepID=A0A7I8J3X6_SPIIN|nr:unnamed protein product [Spirodela intermedia]CAA6664790.1 unnamed protein product [Spirodela intermedia]
MSGLVVAAAGGGASLGTAGYDRAKEVREFDESKIGVKGLVDGGLASIPRFFHHPSSSLNLPPPAAGASIPVVDLSLPHHRAVELTSAAARDWDSSRSPTTGSLRRHLRRPLRRSGLQRAPHRGQGGVLHQKSVRRRLLQHQFRPLPLQRRHLEDTLQITMGPSPVDPSRIPEVCRRDLLAWDGYSLAVASKLFALLSEGLGAAPARLEELSCLKGRQMVCHYYPYCPQPHLTLGLAGHTDPGVLTVLIQNEVPGLQVRKASAGEAGGGDAWVEVDPIPGAIIVNVGDTLQMISNDEYRSVEHKVVANPSEKGRVSVGTFYNPGQRDGSSRYGPLQELISLARPARYREFTMPEFMGVFFSKELGSKSLLDHFRS